MRTLFNLIREIEFEVSARAILFDEFLIPCLEYFELEGGRGASCNPEDSSSGVDGKLGSHRREYFVYFSV
jgi:hypothetical protein